MYGAQLLQMGGRVERPDMESRMDPAHQPRFEVPYQKKIFELVKLSDQQPEFKRWTTVRGIQLNMWAA
jgi:hypothetical protein